MDYTKKGPDAKKGLDSRNISIKRSLSNTMRIK